MAQKKYDVLVVGELNVDIILNEIDSFPEMGKEKLAQQMSVVMGSSSAILASNLSSLGAKVGFIGKIGNDMFGQVILDELKLKGVDTSYIIKSQQLKTGATIVMSFDNDRANITYPGAMNDLTIADISDAMLQSARHLHFSSCFLQPGIKNDLLTLFKRAKEAGLTTSIDPQWDPAEKWDLDLNALLPYVDFFMPNESELNAICKKNTLQDSLASVKNYHHLVVKMGTKGASLYAKGSKSDFAPFLNESVVDTVGAGDSFNAGFLFKFLQGAPLDVCMTFASLTGAVSTTAAGGTGAFKNYEHVMNVIKNKFNYTEKHETAR